MRLSDRSLHRLRRELRELTDAQRLRSMDWTEIRDRLAELAEAIERPAWTRPEPSRRAPSLVAVGLLGLAGAAVLWLVWDASRRQQLQRQLDEWREASVSELRDTIQRGRAAAEHALSQLPAEPEEARRLVQQAADALEEVTVKLREAALLPQSR